MPIWTLFGIRHGVATSASAGDPAHDKTQHGVLGMPRLMDGNCAESCRACVDVCLPGALSFADAANNASLSLDYGKCVACQLCTEVCPDGSAANSAGPNPAGASTSASTSTSAASGPRLQTSHRWAFGVRNREDLLWAEAVASAPAQELKESIRRYFGGSLHIRHVDAGSCNGCESELQALNNPLYNLHRLGIFFTPTPRAADLLLVTGSVTYAMREALLAAYKGMPEPKWVMAVGACAISGGASGGGYSCEHGLEGILPVDLYLPGCPPNPAAIIHALLMLVNRASQRVVEGHYAQ